MPRPCNCRLIENLPSRSMFGPIPPREKAAGQEIVMSMDALEALRLADLKGFDMDTAARQMGISRHTFGRLLRKARKCAAAAICEGRNLRIDGGICVITKLEGAISMSEEILVAVPSEEPGGLDAKPSAHFGHCAAYTVAKISDGKIGDVRIEPNRGHEHGGCVQPVQELARQGVTVLLAGGMGMRPLNAMHEAGIKVFYTVSEPSVRSALEAFAAGKLQAFGEESLCRGHCGHHS